MRASTWLPPVLKGLRRFFAFRQRQPNLHSHRHAGASASPSLFLLPAFTVLPFVRSRLGYEIVNPARALWRNAVMLATPIVVNLFYRPAFPLGYEYLAAFALLSQAWYGAFYLRLIFGSRYNQPHSHDAGYSVLACRTPLPLFLTEVVLIPGCVAALGYAACRLSIDLGVWLMASGLSLALLAVSEGSRRYEARRLASDGLIQSQISFEQSAGSTARSRSLGDNVIHFADLQ